MTVAVARRSMPRRKDTDPKRNDVPVKMDAEVIRKARIVAAYRQQNLAEFLSNTLGAIVDDLLEQEHARETKAPRGSKSKGEGRA